MNESEPPTEERLKSRTNTQVVHFVLKKGGSGTRETSIKFKKFQTRKTWGRFYLQKKSGRSLIQVVGKYNFGQTTDKNLGKSNQA